MTRKPIKVHCLLRYGIKLLAHTCATDTTDISEFFGLAKCTVLPPEKLYHPLLLLRQSGKLTFPLCATCVEDEMAKPMLERSHICTHTDQQRQIIGT